MKPNIESRRTRAPSWKGSAIAFLATLLALPGHAAIQVPNSPPGAKGVAPNILFILDDSGSMGANGGQFMDMPDFNITGSGNVASADGSRNAYDEDDDFKIDDGDDGDQRRDINFFSYTNNTLYYNPTITYRPWRKHDGTFMADTAYTSAWRDLDLASSATDLSNRDRAFHVPKSDMLGGPATVDLTQAVNYYRYQFKAGNAGADLCEWINTSGTWSWGNCVPIITVSWVRQTAVGPELIVRTLAQEKANFANWFSFHRTRMKAAKAGAGYAFYDLNGDDYRVGYNSIWNRNSFPIPVGSDNGLFRGDNRKAWFDSLYAAVGSGTTPLRAALQRAGEYFTSDAPYGGDLDASGQQFQCRQNFSILTTDGFWNNDSTSVGNSDYVPGELISAPPLPDGTPGATYQYLPVAPYSGSDSGTLADVAMEFWKKDLRLSMANIVPTSAANPAFWQHMVTFGISIGLRGTLPYTSVQDVLKAGAFTWPNPMDDPGLGGPDRIDDLLHAAVNGRGEFVAATDPAAFAKALKNALGTIGDRTGSASSVAASSTSISTDTRLFQGKYQSGIWSGEVVAYPVTAAGINATNPIWKASEKFPAWASRRIFTTDAVGIRGTFPTGIQNTALGTSAGGFSIANYLRGDASGEVKNSGDLRNRPHPLGDVIHSSPFYSRDTDTLYVGANDGMLHAFQGASGREVFAYIPRGVQMAQLKELSALSYAHRYFVDGPVTVSDRAMTRTTTYPNGRNILVGTLGRGGKGVFALDVTDPGTFDASKVMLDIAGDADMGLVMGKPIIARLNDGSVNVIFGNGINSTNEKAVLWVVNVDTGAVTKLATNAAGNNGLSGPRAWDSDGDGIVDLVYAGDQLGNLWKFSLEGNNRSDWGVAGGNNPNKINNGNTNAHAPLFIATDAGGKRQPISGAVSFGVDPANYKLWVFFGTGRLLSNADYADTSVQTMYGIIDGVPIGTRAANDDANGLLVERTIADSGSIAGKPVRAFESSSVTMPVGKRGWFVDLLTPPNRLAEGERIIGDAQVVGPVFITSSIIPSSDPCMPGGRGYINAINAFTGGSVSEHFFDVDGDKSYSDDEINGKPVGSIDLGVGMNTDSVLIDKLLSAGGSSGGAGSVGVNPSSASGRVSWREVLRK